MRPHKKHQKPNIYRFHDQPRKSAPFFGNGTPLTSLQHKHEDELLSHEGGASKKTNYPLFRVSNPFASVVNCHKIETSLPSPNDVLPCPEKFTIPEKTTQSSQKPTKDQLNEKIKQINSDSEFESNLFEQVDLRSTALSKTKHHVGQQVKEGQISLSSMLTHLIDKLIRNEGELRKAKMRDQQQIVQMVKNKEKTKYVLEPSLMKRKVKPRPYRSDYTVCYSGSVVCVTNGREYRGVQGSFHAGYIDPYCGPTVRQIVERLQKSVSGVVRASVSSMVIYECECMIEMGVVFYVKQLVLMEGLQFSHCGYSEGVVKGLRVCNEYVQVRWERDIAIETQDLREDIRISKYNIWVSEKFQGGLHITFRRMQLAEHTVEQFCEMLRDQCPGLNIEAAKSVKYDRYLGLGVISL